LLDNSEDHNAYDNKYLKIVSHTISELIAKDMDLI
jgi:hypothetical protein